MSREEKVWAAILGTLLIFASYYAGYQDGKRAGAKLVRDYVMSSLRGE